MSRVKISFEMCKGCGLCIAVCPRDCLEYANELNRYGVYPVRMKAEADCRGCCQCATMCPDTGIEVYRSERKKPDREESE